MPVTRLQKLIGSNKACENIDSEVFCVYAGDVQSQLQDRVIILLTKIN